MRHETRRGVAAPALLLAAVAGWTAACGGAGGNGPASGAAPAVPRAQPPEEVRAELVQAAERLEAGQALFVGGSLEAELRRALAAVPPGGAAEWEARERLGRELLRLGDSSGALEELEAAWRIEKRMRAGRPEGAGEPPSALLPKLMVAGMRLGEQANCVGRHDARSCILPITGGGVHADTRGARTAMAYALESLAAAPGDLKALWFLNLAAMQAGAYPGDVPERWRIPPERFVSAEPLTPLTDVATALGLDTFDQAGGSIAEDFDGDGLVDIITSTMDPRGSLRYFRNAGDGTFQDRTRTAGLDTQLGGLNAVQTDFDNDGRADVLVLRGGWLQGQGRIRNSLLRNNGDGTFGDVTRAAGLAEPAYPTQAAAWGDYDGDGDLDLFVGNEGEEHPEGAVLFPDNLYRNNGDGTFTDVAAAAGVAGRGYAKGAAWGDYDGDGDPDLYVSHIGPNALYRNNGDGTFTDVAPELGVTEPAGRSFATWFFDYDNDGDLDLFVACYRAEVENIAADVLGRPTRPDLWPRLYRNDAGRFTDVTAAAGLGHPSLPMGANFGDLDGDGFLDIYLGTGAPAYEALMPNLLYRNRGDGTFVDVTYAAGLGHLQKGHGISFADFDQDGDMDLHLQAGGFFPGDRFANALFENPGPARRFLAVKVVGTRSARAGLGARLHVRVATPAGERSIYRWVGSGGSFGASPLEQQIGLGEATDIVSLEVIWPAGGLPPQRFRDVPLDAAITVTEGEEQVVRRERRPLRLGGAPQPASSAASQARQRGSLPGR